MALVSVLLLIVAGCGGSQTSAAPTATVIAPGPTVAPASPVLTPSVAPSPVAAASPAPATASPLPAPSPAAAAAAAAAAATASVRPSAAAAQSPAASPAAGGVGKASADAGAPVTAGPLDATQSGLQLGFQNIHYYRDSIGGLWFFGEVTNNGPAAVADIGFYLNLYSQSGDRTARSSVLRISHSILDPGQTGVWVTDMSDNPNQWAKVEFQYAEQVGARDEPQRTYTDLQTSDVSVGPPSNGSTEMVVTGKVRNSGSETAKIDNFTAALYAADGTLAWVSDNGLLFPGDPNAPLAAGAMAPFQVDLTSYSGKPDRVEVYPLAHKASADAP